MSLQAGMEIYVVAMTLCAFLAGAISAGAAFFFYFRKKFPVPPVANHAHTREEREKKRHLRQMKDVAGGISNALRRQLDKKKYRVDKPFLEGERYYFYAYALFRGGYAQIDGPRVKVAVGAADKEVRPIFWRYQDGVEGGHHTLIFPNGFDEVAGKIAEYLKSLRGDAVLRFGE